MVDLSTGGYAISDDLTAWLDGADLPDQPVRMLRSGSLRVALACQRNPYNDTPNTSDAAPLRDATCAQVAAWTALGITPDRLGIGAAPVKKSSILTGDVERDTSTLAKSLDAAINELCPEAEAILQAAGLLWHATASVGDSELLHYGLSGSPGFGSDTIEFANSTDAWPFF